jgi:hypothetical protein
VVFARFPGEHPPCKGSLFLISQPFARTLFGSQGTFLSPVGSNGQAGSLLHLRPLASYLYTTFGMASEREPDVSSKVEFKPIQKRVGEAGTGVPDLPIVLPKAEKQFSSGDRGRPKARSYLHR